MSTPGVDMELVDKCVTFFEEDVDDWPDGEAVYIEASDLGTYDDDLLDDYLTHPKQVNRAFVAATEEMDVDREYEVRLTDEDEHLEPTKVADLEADDLGSFVAVEGQLAKVSEKTPRFTEATFRCERCEYRVSINQPRTGWREPPNNCEGCDRKGIWRVIEGPSRLVDQRTVKLKTPPGERAQGEGESVIAYADGELTDVGGENGLPDRAGERVVVLGRYEMDATDLTRGSRPTVDPYVVAESIVFVERDLADITVEETKDEFMRLANGEQGDPVDLFKESIAAPRIFPTDEIDQVLEASVAWLFNGYRVEPAGGDHIRGDLHLGIIGDPSTGKSTILSVLSKIAPRSVFRSGGSISKVGLTAAARQEEFAGKTEWTLEPGVLPRANGGHCLIDEADELLGEKTKAIHDALEGEQLVKVDKAGIRANLPSRTALCIAGNPKDGRFDPYSDIAEQIDMDPALISRMDVLLPVTDSLDPEQDRKIADKIIESYDELSRADLAGEEAGSETDVDRPVSIQVMRDWVHYARDNCKPTLTSEAGERLKEMYFDVRNLNQGYESGEEDKPIPATARVVEAGIRLSTAFARVELADEVLLEHVERAQDILKASIGLNFDKEVMVFDADETTKATPKSQKDRNNLILSIIDEMEEPRGPGVPREKIIERAVEEGMEETKAGHTITRLSRRGDIYEPEMDKCFRVV